MQKSGEFYTFLVLPSVWKACQWTLMSLLLQTSWFPQEFTVYSYLQCIALMHMVSNILTFKLTFILEITVGFRFIQMRITVTIPSPSFLPSPPSSSPSLPFLFSFPANTLELCVIIFEEWVYLIYCWVLLNLYSYNHPFVLNFQFIFCSLHKKKVE